MEIVFGILLTLVGYALGHISRGLEATKDLREAGEYAERLRDKLVGSQQECLNLRHILALYKREYR